MIDSGSWPSIYPAGAVAELRELLERAEAAEERVRTLERAARAAAATPDSDDLQHAANLLGRERFRLQRESFAQEPEEREHIVRRVGAYARVEAWMRALLGQPAASED